MNYAALDVGSSFIKGAVLDTDRLCVSGFEQIATPPNTALQPTRCEIDGEMLFAAIRTLLHRLLDQQPDIRGILLCTQMHGYILTDSRFKPVTPYVTWQDRASTEPGPDGLSTLDRLRQTLPLALMNKAGVPVKANLAMCSLLARGRVPEGALLCTVGGYIIGRLGHEHVCHHQNAAPTGMTDAEHGTWQTELIRLAGLDGLIFPRIVRDMEPCGTYAYQGKRYALYPDLGDQQACVLGSLVRPETDLNINIGTAGLISCACSRFERGSYETRPYFENLYLKTVSGLSGGRRLDALAAHIAMQAGCGKDDVWPMITGDLPNAGWRQEVLDTYAAIGQEYREAGRRISDAFTRIVFSGGCAGRNPALRSAIQRETAIPLSAGALGMDSMLGMLQLALILSKEAKNIEETRHLIESTYRKGDT